MSVFHQLSAGNSGRGPGTAPLAAGTVAGHCAAAMGTSSEHARATAAGARRRIGRKILVLCQCHNSRRNARWQAEKKRRVARAVWKHDSWASVAHLLSRVIGQAVEVAVELLRFAAIQAA